MSIIHFILDNSGTSTVGRTLHSLVLETSPSSVTLKTGVSANTGNQITPTLILSNGGLNTLGVQTSQQVESTATVSIPSRTDSGRQTTTDNLLSIHTSRTQSRLAFETYQGLESTATVSIPFWVESKTPSIIEASKENSFDNSDQQSCGMYLLSVTHTRLAAHTPTGLETTATVSIPSWTDSRTILLKNTASGNSFSNQPHKGIHPSSTSYTRLVTQMPIHTSFQVPHSTAAVSTISSTTVGRCMGD